MGRREFDPRELSDRVERLVEIFVKLKEMRKAKEAREKRLEMGGYEGTPPVGMQFDDSNMFLEPDEEFEEVLNILELRAQGKSYNDILEETDLTNSSGTLSNILDRRDDYIEWAVEHDYDVDNLLAEV